MPVFSQVKVVRGLNSSLTQFHWNEFCMTSLISPCQWVCWYIFMPLLHCKAIMPSTIHLPSVVIDCFIVCLLLLVLQNVSRLNNAKDKMKGENNMLSGSASTLSSNASLWGQQLWKPPFLPCHTHSLCLFRGPLVSVLSSVISSGCLDLPWDTARYPQIT